MSTVIETTPLGDVEAETEASRARAARDAEERRERRALEASRRKETRETCERLLTFLRVVATESGRARETETFGDGNEGLAHRGRLLKLRVRVARVRMQPKRARRPASRVRENGNVRDDGGGLRRQRSLAEMATRNAARLAGRDRGDAASPSPTPSGYASDRSFGTTTYSEGETSSRLEDLLALLAHAPYEHESLEDGGRPRGWTGSGSTMSRTGVIRVGVDHQARVEATTDATFARGTMDAREERYLGTMAWPTTNVVKASSSSPVRAGTRPSALRGTKSSTRPEVEEKEEKETEKKDDVKTEKKETADEDEKDDKDDDEDDATTERRPLVSEEDIAASRRALEENLRRAGVGESLLGLATIGAAGSSARWNEEEKTTFAEHVNKYCDDLFRLCVKLPDKTMRDVVDYYYNVWQVGCKNHGRVDVDGAEEPAHGVRGVGRGRGRPRGAAPKFTSEEVRRERDDKSIQNFVDWIRGVAMNTKRAMLNVHRAPTTARFKGHMMTRWRSVAFDSSDGAKEYLKDLTRRMHAAKFTPEEREAAAKMKAEARRPGRPPKSAVHAAEKRAAAPPSAKDSDDATAPATTVAKRGKKAKTRDSGEDAANAENEKKKPTGKRIANAKKRASDGLKTKDRNFIL